MILSAAIAATGAVSLAAGTAKADTVNVRYYTEGKFTNADTGSSTYGFGSSSFTFNGQAPQSLADVGTTPVDAPFGSFTWSSTVTTPPPDKAEAIPFYVIIHQVLPSAGADTVVGTLAGTLQLQSNRSGSFDAGTLSVSFSDPDGTITDKDWSVHYHVNGLSNFTIGKGVSSAPLGGTVYAEAVPAAIVPPVAVPLPAAVWSGLSLIGMLGAARVRKSREA